MKINLVSRVTPNLLIGEGHARAPKPNVMRGGHQFRLFGLFWYTYDQDNPDFFGAIDADGKTRMESSYVRKGYNYTTILDALTKRINARNGNVNDEIIEGTGVYLGRYQFRGESIFDLAAMLDVAWFGHWIPKEHIEQIKTRSSVGTKIILFHDWESIKQATPWDNRQAIYWTDLRNSYTGESEIDYTSGCNSDGKNGYGCPSIDKYEDDDRTGDPCSGSWTSGKIACPHVQTPHAGLPSAADLGSTHTWDRDIYHETTDDGGENMMNNFSSLQLAVSTLKANDGTYLFDGFAYDNVLSVPFKGNATNEYSATHISQYTNSWNTFLQAHWLPTNQATTLQPHQSLWGNAEIGVQTYSKETLPNRYNEFFFIKNGTTIKTWSDIETDLATIAAGNVNVVFGINGFLQNQYYWATTTGGPDPAIHGSWELIHAEARRLGIGDHIFAPVIQMIDGGFMAHQYQWRKIK